MSLSVATRRHYFFFFLYSFTFRQAAEGIQTPHYNNTSVFLDRRHDSRTEELGCVRDTPTHWCGFLLLLLLIRTLMFERAASLSPRGSLSRSPALSPSLGSHSSHADGPRGAKRRHATRSTAHLGPRRPASRGRGPGSHLRTPTPPSATAKLPSFILTSAIY